MKNNRWAALGLPAVAAAIALSGSPALAATPSERDGVQASGRCSGGSTWELKAKTDDGGIEVEFEVDSNVVGQTWNVGINDNGVAIFRGSRVTQAPSGSFSVELITANRAGADKFVGGAKNPSTGETCRGNVTL